MSKPCEHCGSRRVRVFCGDCDGNGGWWSRVVYFDADGDDQRWQECRPCAGTGKLTACSNFLCPGKKRYVMGALDRAILRAVNGGEGGSE